MICDRKRTARVKGNIYKMVVRPTTLYGLLSAALTKKDRRRLDMRRSERELRLSPLDLVT